MTSGFDTAVESLTEARTLYEKAAALAETSAERSDLDSKIAGVDESIALLMDKAASGLKPARWGREITELSFAELLLYLRKLYGDDDALIASYKEEKPGVYANEVKAVISRTRELEDLAEKRIIRRIDASGPEFDTRNVLKAMTEFKFLTFTLTSVVDDEEMRTQTGPRLEDLSERIKIGILQNHLRFPDVRKKLSRILLDAQAKATSDINESFSSEISLEELRAKIISNEGDKYFDSVKEFAAEITERMKEYTFGRDSYFVEVLVPPTEDDALSAARILWDKGYPLLRLKFIGGDRYAMEKNYQLAVGWYRNSSEAEQASQEIQEIPEAFEHISGISIRDGSQY
jgi:hypothetical protein